MGGAHWHETPSETTAGETGAHQDAKDDRPLSEVGTRSARRHTAVDVMAWTTVATIGLGRLIATADLGVFQALR